LKKGRKYNLKTLKHNSYIFLLFSYYFFLINETLLEEYFWGTRLVDFREGRISLAFKKMFKKNSKRK